MSVTSFSNSVLLMVGKDVIMFSTDVRCYTSLDSRPPGGLKGGSGYKTNIILELVKMLKSTC